MKVLWMLYIVYLVFALAAAILLAVALCKVWGK